MFLKNSLALIFIMFLLFALACDKETNTEPTPEDHNSPNQILVSHDGLLTKYNPPGQMIGEFQFPGYLFDVNQQTGDIWTTSPSNDKLYRLALDGTILDTITIENANHPCINQGTGDCWLTGETEESTHFYCANSSGQITRDFPNEAFYLHGVSCDETLNQVWGAEAFSVSKFTMDGDRLFTIDGHYYQPTDLCVVQQDGSCWIGWIKTGTPIWTSFLAHYSQNGQEMARVDSFGGALDVKQDDKWIVCADESSHNLQKCDSGCNLIWSVPWRYGHIVSIDINQKNGNIWVLTYTDAVRVGPDGVEQRVLSSFGEIYCLRLYEPAT